MEGKEMIDKKFIDENLEFVKSDFLRYLNLNYMHLDYKQTIISDAFYIFRFDIGIDPMLVMNDDTAIKLCKEKLIEKFTSKKRANPSGSASSYCTHINLLKEYINSENNLAQQKYDFNQWLEDNPSTNGYTVKLYSNSIDNITKFARENKIFDKNLFEIKQNNVLDKTINLLKKENKYNEKNKKNNNTWSAALGNYSKFLIDNEKSEFLCEEKKESYERENNLYSKIDFLNDVFILEEKYETIVSLLSRKKNLILQGAPGVGKTYAAKRLAYSLIGEKNNDRVQLVQFHQSYSYEDFVMGYRPDTDGFKLVDGVFYNFCKKAQLDNENNYFFIIDEINRGNLSKIFGELFMLIEHDKRDENNSLQLLYSDEQFYIPSNVHIIGMMNTADRSLAMLDYALRRRFAFFEIEPAFDSKGFKQYQNNINNEKFNALITQIKILNEVIKTDSSLGDGFRIGHSYFIKIDDETVDDIWLHTIVKYEIIPLLQEYWFDESSKVNDWILRLENSIS